MNTTTVVLFFFPLLQRRFKNREAARRVRERKSNQLNTLQGQVNHPAVVVELEVDLKNGFFKFPAPKARVWAIQCAGGHCCSTVRTDSVWCLGNGARSQLQEQGACVHLNQLVEPCRNQGPSNKSSFQCYLCVANRSPSSVGRS